MFLSWWVGSDLPAIDSLLVAIWALPLALFIAWFMGEDLLQLMTRRPFLRPVLTQLLWVMLVLLAWAVVPG